MPKEIKQTITLRSPTGKEIAQIEAIIVGSYGIHTDTRFTRQHPYWTVTHVASGIVIRVCDSKDQALGLAQKLIDELGDTSRWEREELFRRAYQIVKEYP